MVCCHLQMAATWVGLAPACLSVAAYSRVSPTDRPWAFRGRARVVPAQARWPTCRTYGPMRADGDIGVEEWDCQIYGASGERYNNQYCWMLRFEGEEVV